MLLNGRNCPTMIETNTTQKDWDDFWESVNEDQSIPTERELFESNDDDKSLTNAYVDDVLSGKNSICKRESPLSE